MVLLDEDPPGYPDPGTRVYSTAKGTPGRCYACGTLTTNAYEPCWTCKWLPIKAARMRPLALPEETAAQ